MKRWNLRCWLGLHNWVQFNVQTDWSVRSCMRCLGSQRRVFVEDHWEWIKK